jgi:uncharacterized protein (UPF0262 family)
VSATHRICRVELDEESLAPAHADAEHERDIAIFDLIESNRFSLFDSGQGVPTGPFALHLALLDNKLMLDIRDEADQPIRVIVLSLSPFRRVVKDYFAICESYYDAIRRLTPAQIEAIDMARRGLHNEGCELLMERLEGKVTLDFETARRLFTLVCALFPPAFIR